MTDSAAKLCVRALALLSLSSVASPASANWDKYSFSLADSSGAVVTSERYRNRPLFMVVWATWCAPCIANFPKLQQLHNEFARNGRLAVVSVHFGRNYGRYASAAGFQKSGGYTVPVLQDPDGKLTRKLNWMPFMVSVPKYILFDGEGKVVVKYDDLDDKTVADLRRRYGSSARTGA